MGDSRELEIEIGESSGEITKRKRGRPAKDGGRDKRVGFRITETDEEMLDFICNQRGINKTEAFQLALRTQYNLAKYQVDNDV